MKNKLLILLVILVFIFAFAGCKAKDDTEIAGVVIETSEGGGFRVEIIGGFQEDLMQVHMSDKVKYEEGTDENIQIGNAVGFTIGDEVMESYPVQATAKKILWNEKVITGEILSDGDAAILIKVQTGFDSQLLQAHITEETIFYKNIPALTEKGKIIGFTTMGETLDTEPPQVFVKRFVIYN